LTARGWTAIGARLDSAGEAEGEERAPAALRAAGLLAELGADDRGDIEATIATSARDPATGVIGYGDVVAASEELRLAVAAVLARGRRPLVLGGDCTLLIGALAGARARTDGALGLAFVDGHLDCYDGRTSPTGECADMDLAIVTGGGPRGLAALGGEAPIVDPADVAVIGFRPDPDPDTIPEGDFTLERDLVDPRIETIEAREVLDPTALGRRIERRLAAVPGGFWLHLDADVLDPEAMPAVSYPEPSGLSWEQCAALLGPLGASPALLGASVADLNSDRDPDGRYARRLTELVAAALAPA
jgi:arginase